MKIGCLLRKTSPKKLWGVVVKDDGKKIHVWWFRAYYEATVYDRIPYEELNKKLITGLIRAPLMEGILHEQEASRKKN